MCVIPAQSLWGWGDPPSRLNKSLLILQPSLWRWRWPLIHAQALTQFTRGPCTLMQAPLWRCSWHWLLFSL
jgi:hypothetical protein